MALRCVMRRPTMSLTRIGVRWNGDSGDSGCRVGRASTDGNRSSSNEGGNDGSNSSSSKTDGSRALLWTKVGAALTGGVGAVYYADRTVNASALTRTLRTLYVGTLLVWEYKFNFRADDATLVDRIHERVAERLMDLIRANGGLYIKLGQAIAMQASILPQAYYQAFQTLFDEAPQVSYPELEQVFLDEFGMKPEDVFVEFDTVARASASIAQVHRAVLVDGSIVAVKIQKPQIRKQIKWDLFAYRALMYAYDRLFQIPVYFTVDFISRHLVAETDFAQEARNAIELNEHLQRGPLADSVHIPRVYPEYSGKRVLTAEWVDGCRITDKEQIEKMGLNMSHVMHTFVSLFSAQIFMYGHVHCDAHPGNVFVRKKANGNHEIVLIDHGLYIREPNSFRIQYCKLWKALMTYDRDTLSSIAAEWGFNFPDLLGTITLMRPYSSKSKAEKALPEDEHSPAEAQLKLKQRLQDFLSNTQNVPLELVFLERTMRIIQATNQMTGSTVNRPGIMADWAFRALASQPGLNHLAWMREWMSHIRFSLSMFLLNIGFWISRIRQVIFQQDKAGLEDILQRQVKAAAKGVFGLDLKDEVFSG